MKKTILSLIALFSVAVVSAQSYAKQPDPTIYEVVKYQKPAAPETEIKEQSMENKADESQAQPNADRKTEKTSSEVKSSTAVAVNDEKASAKKRQ